MWWNGDTCLYLTNEGVEHSDPSTLGGGHPSQFYGQGFHRPQLPESNLARRRLFNLQPWCGSAWSRCITPVGRACTPGPIGGIERVPCGAYCYGHGGCPYAKHYEPAPLIGGTAGQPLVKPLRKSGNAVVAEPVVPCPPATPGWW